MPEGFKPSIDRPSDNTIPLLEFSGVLKDYVAEDRKDDRSGRTWTTITFNFTDLEVIETTEPYPFPIAKIQIPYGTRSKTRWAVFAESARGILPQVDIDLLVGKRQKWVWGSCELRQQVDGEWKNVEADSWQVVEVEGYGNSGEDDSNLIDALVELADGKTEAEFNSAVFSDEKLKKMGGYSSAVDMIINRKFFDAMKEIGKLEKSGDNWVKVSNG